MEIAIRPIAAPDRGQWEPLWHGYLHFYEATPDARVTDTTWSRLIDPDQDPHGLAAVDGDNALVGIVHYLFHRSTWTEGDYCYLQDLFVAPDIRGGGVGRALILAVYDAADAAGASQVYWLTQHFNETARRLYDEVGTLTPFIKYRRP